MLLLQSLRMEKRVCKDAELRGGVGDRCCGYSGESVLSTVPVIL